MRWNARYPAILIATDRRGHIVRKHFGEGGYAQTEEAIRALLAARA